MLAVDRRDRSSEALLFELGWRMALSGEYQPPIGSGQVRQDVAHASRAHAFVAQRSPLGGPSTLSALHVRSRHPESQHSKE